MFTNEQLNQIKKYLSNPTTEAEKILNKSILESVMRGNEIFVAVMGEGGRTYGRTCFMSADNFISLIALQIYRMIVDGAFTEEEAFTDLKKGIEFYKAQDNGR